MRQAHKLTSEFPEICFAQEEIQFHHEIFERENRLYFCKFHKYGTTPTGKKTKYPMSLGFYVAKNPLAYKMENTFLGEIFYQDDNEIGKMHIVAWIKGICHIVNVLRKKGKDLEITNIKKDNLLIYKS